jgi:hypothetical protein
MAYKCKEEAEKEFVDHILSVGGILSCSEMDCGNATYYKFSVKNGETRYWTNMSEENLKRLGATK